MATDLPTAATTNGHINGNGHSATEGEDNFAVKAGLARMLKGGVIMDVINAEQVCYSCIRQPPIILQRSG